MSSGLTNGRVTYGLVKPLPWQTWVNVYYTGKSSGSVLYTVPAGKTLYIIGLICENDAAVTTNMGITTDNGTVEFYTNTIGSMSTNSGTIIITASATTDVTCRWTGAAGHAAGSFWGWYE